MHVSAQLLDQVLSLPPGERADFVRQVLNRFERDVRVDSADVDDLWITEIDARFDRTHSDSSLESEWRAAVERIRSQVRNDFR